MSSPSVLLKVNYLIMRYLHFISVLGDLQEGHGCASRCQYHLFPLPIPFFPSTKSGFLCAFGVWNPRFRAFRAQNRHFCARAEGQVASGSVKVTFLQFTAQANVPQRCLEQGFVCSVICRNCATDNQQHHLPPNTCALGWQHPHPAPNTCVLAMQ